jgi:hypothetical protein
MNMNNSAFFKKPLSQAQDIKTTESNTVIPKKKKARLNKLSTDNLRPHDTIRQDQMSLPCETTEIKLKNWGDRPPNY